MVSTSNDGPASAARSIVSHAPSDPRSVACAGTDTATGGQISGSGAGVRAAGVDKDDGATDAAGAIGGGTAAKSAWGGGNGVNAAAAGVNGCACASTLGASRSISISSA